MKQLLLLITVLSFLSTHLFGQVPDASVPPSITTNIDIYSDDDQSFADKLIKLIKQTPLTELPNLLDSMEVTSISSDDGVIRCYSWNAEILDTSRDQSPYMYLVEYPTASGESRFSYTKPFWSGPDRHSVTNMWAKESATIKNIEKVRQGVYLIDTDTDTEHKLYAIDIRNGMLKNAFVFTDPETEQPHMVISMPKDSHYYTDNKDVFVLIGNLLKVRENEPDLLNGYRYYFYNQSQFLPFDKYGHKPELPDAGICPIDRLYWTDPNNCYVLDGILRGMGWSSRADVSFDAETAFLPDNFLVELTLSASDDEDILPYSVKMFLRPFNDLYRVQNFNPDALPLNHSFDNETFRVDIVCGAEWCFNQELACYTAIALSTEFPEEEYFKIRWAISLDNDEIQLLDPAIHKGPQIELYIKDEWIGKTITVMAFVEGQEPDKNISVKTEVGKYY